MRRRRRERVSSVPEHLRVFDPAAWGGDQWQALDAWGRARKVHFAEHPDAWAHMLEVLGGTANARARLSGRPPIYSHWDEGHER